MAVHLAKARLTQPIELLGQAGKTIGEIILHSSDGVTDAWGMIPLTQGESRANDTKEFRLAD